MTQKDHLEVAEYTEEPKEFTALEASQVRQIVKGEKVSLKKEPQMRALRRILGHNVLDVFPLGIIQAVDASYKFWLENPDSFLDTPFESEAEKDDALLVMRAYAECADDGGYSIRTVKTDDPCLLSWRAQNRRGSGITV
jgi:hypothetical protein